MKKVKRMMFGGVSKAVGKTLEQVSKMPGGVNRNAPADVQKIIAGLPRGSTVAGPGTGLGVKPTVTGAPDKNLPFTINNKPTPNVMGLGTAAQANPRIPASVQNAISNLKAGNIPKARPGSMVGQRFGGMGMKEGGKVSSASKRADGIAVKGKTRGRMV